MYLDTSVLVAYYCPEPSSRQADRLVRSVTAPTISDLTELELRAALARKARMGDLTITGAQRIAAEFTSHLAGNFFRRVAIERRHFEMAGDWMLRFEFSVRTLDALHMAVASLDRLRLATLDQALARAARGLGLRVAGVTRA